MKQFKKQKLSHLCKYHYMLTQLGIVDCLVAEFDSTKYRGLKQNCGRTPRKQTVTTPQK